MGETRASQYTFITILEKASTDDLAEIVARLDLGDAFSASNKTPQRL